MYSYIIIHHTHESVNLALFVHNSLHNSVTLEKRLVSKMLIPSINTLLEENAIAFSDLAFIGINQGPGLFSTLRSIIATVNGLHFATNIPLIGVDALTATAHEYYSDAYPYTIVLLDAFNHEVYYAITHNNTIIATGYKNSAEFLNHIAKEYSEKKVYFIGRGVEVYKSLITEICKDMAVIPDIIPDICSLNAVASAALEMFTYNKTGHGYLFPLHLKKHPVELL